MKIEAQLAHLVNYPKLLSSYLFTWQRVRGVGEFQLLTKASYGMLILVPMLVTFWPSVRTLINGHNHLLEQITDRLDAVSQKLDKQATTLAVRLQANLDEKLPSIADGQGPEIKPQAAVLIFADQIHTLSADVADALTTLRQAGTLSPWLPQSLALTFFAALAVATGHAVYQAKAPVIIRRFTSAEYIRGKRDAYREQPDEEEFRDALRRMRLVTFDEDQKSRPQDPRSWIISWVTTTWVNSQNDLVEDQRRQEADRLIRLLRSTSFDDIFKNNANGNNFATADEKLDIYKSLQAELQGEIVNTLDGINRENAGRKLKDHLIFRALLRFRKNKVYWYDRLNHAYTASAIIGSKVVSEDKRAELATFYRIMFGLDIADQSRQNLDSKKVDVIGDAARLDYRSASKAGAAAISVALVAYGTGACILLWTMARQSFNVMSAAGWLN